MVLRSLVAASVGAVLSSRSSANKGKAASPMDPYRRDYGAAAYSDRRPFISTSHSGERLYRVPEDADDSLSDVDAMPSSWNNVRDCGDECNGSDEEEWHDPPCTPFLSIPLFHIHRFSPFPAS